MSLQVWLPFTDGTLKQQGLSDVSATIGGSINLTEAGKLGKCATIGATTGGITLPASTMTSFTECSVAFWINITAWNTSWDTFFQAGLGSTPWNHYIFGILRNQGDYLCFTISNGSSTSSAGYISSNLTIGQWMHLAFTYSNKKCKIYINGALDKEYSTSIAPNFAGITHISIGRGTSSGYQSKCKLNDFRIYDHCLSPMEVKQISQGLVLHYPLNREGWGQENLMPNSTIMSVGSANASTGSWRVAGSSQMTRSRVAISDSPIGDVYGCQSVGLQTGQDASCWGIDRFPRENGTTYTISAWGRIVGGSTTAAMLGFSVYSGTTLDYGGTYGQAKSSDTKYYGSGAYDYAGGQLNPNGSWTRIYRTFTSTSTSDNIYVGFNTAKTGNSVTLQLCGVKLEKGDKVTSWCPKNTDDLADVIGLNDTTEYDTSGFGNNGTRIGTLEWNGNSPKYSVCTKFTTTNNSRIEGIIPAPILPMGESVGTLSAWVYPIQRQTASDRDLIIYVNGVYLTINSNGKACVYAYGKNINTYVAGNSIVPLNTWSHLCEVWNESNCFLYINGTLDATISATGTFSGYSTYGNQNRYILIGGEYYYGPRLFNGMISDVRIYATALSADDIKNLYQNSAYINSNGITYAHEFMET